MHIEELVAKLLLTTKDPLLGLLAEELNLDLFIEQKKEQVSLKFNAGFPAQHLMQYFFPLITAPLKQAFPALDFEVELKSFISAHRTQLPGQGLRGVKNTIAIASGKGGVGKSTVAVNLAAALARAGARVGILDADIYGPSIPLMLGPHSPVEIEDNFYLPVRAHNLQAMSIGYLTDSEQALIWRGPMLAKSLLQMINLTRWEELDYLFIDLPPGTGDIQLSLVQKIPLTAAIVVTTPQQIATLDAQKALQMFERTNIEILGLVENMSTHHCKHCGHEEAIFGSDGAEQLSEKFNRPLLGKLPLASEIRNQSDSGFPIALHSNEELSNRFLKIALTAMVELSKKPLNYADKFPKIVIE